MPICHTSVASYVAVLDRYTPVQSNIVWQGSFPLPESGCAIFTVLVCDCNVLPCQLFTTDASPLLQSHRGVTIIIIFGMVVIGRLVLETWSWPAPSRGQTARVTAFWMCTLCTPGMCIAKCAKGGDIFHDRPYHVQIWTFYLMCMVAMIKMGYCPPAPPTPPTKQPTAVVLGSEHFAYITEDVRVFSLPILKCY